MDPLSAAASGFAAASLALQLAGVVQDIHRFLRSVAGASTELERLVDLLEQLDSIIAGVQSLLEQRNTQNDGAPTPVPAIFKALQTCYKTLQPLQKLVEKSQRALQKSNNTASKHLALIKLTLKKRDVEALEEQLQRSMIILQTTIMLNLTQLQ